MRLLTVPGALTCVIAVIVTLRGTGTHREASAIIQGIGVAVPIGIGLWLIARRPDDRFARLLVACGFGLGVVALSSSPNSLLYSVGRTAQWMVVLGVAYLLIAFPGGRPTALLDRRLLAAAAGVLVLLYLPTLPLTVHFPNPTPWSTCVGGCPDNAFAVVNRQPAFVNDVVRPLREVLTVGLVLAFTGVLALRMVRAKPLLRWTLIPASAAGILQLALFAAYLPARGLDPRSPLLIAIGWLYLLTIPAVAIGLVAGLVARRVYAARALERLALSLESHASAGELRRAMAESLEDPTLRIVYRLPGAEERWVDETGWPVEPPVAGPNVAVTEVASFGDRVAAILHDPVLAEDPTIVRAASAHALVALENERLVGQLRASLKDLAQSRRRLVGAADRERRHIEHDLHDGAQQGLVSIRIRLSMLQERLEAVAPEEAATAQALGDEVEAAIDQVRALAMGIYPALLTDRGLADALRSVVRSTPLPIHFTVNGVTRHLPEIESTVYFTCVEALQNVSKHAPAASNVTMTVREDEHLRFEVRDDGPGFDGAIVEGFGLASMRERVTAVGGELTVRSSVGEGTVVSGAIPVANGGPVSGRRR